MRLQGVFSVLQRNMLGNKDLQISISENIMKLSLMDRHSSYLEMFYKDRHTANYMYPKTFRGGTASTAEGKRAEEIVYNILKQINEPMIAMHSKEFCVFETGEMDFLICHKDRGIIILEVKKGTTLHDYDEAHEQLEKAMKAMKRKLKKVKISGDRGVQVRYAVVMPNVSRKFDNPPNEEACYGEDLVSKEAFQDWLNEFMPVFEDRRLSNDNYDKCLSVFLSVITDCYITNVHKSLMKLTPEQAEMLEGLGEEAYITGPAGSGKTWCLVIKASSKEIEEQRKLVVVFNRGIRDHLAMNCLNVVPNLTVKTFRSCLLDIASTRIRKSYLYQLNNHRLVDIAIQTVVSDPGFSDKFDSIFIDEAQGLEGNWQVLFDLLHIKGDQHYKWVFFDNNQMVSYSTPPKPDQRHQIYHLRRVIRNTVNIFNMSMGFYNSKKTPKIAHNIKGPEVVQSVGLTDSDVKDLSPKLVDLVLSYIQEMVSDLRQVGPGDICILAENVERAKSLKEKISGQLGGVFVPFKIEDMVLHIKNGQWPRQQVGWNPWGVTVDSLPRFSGLESKAIILIMDVENTPQAVEKMYVGTTRAICQLRIIFSDHGKYTLSERCELAKSQPLSSNIQWEEDEDEKTMEVE